MAVAALIGAGASMLGSSLGSEAAANAAISGAQTNEYIQRMGTQTQDKLLREQQLMSQPYLNYGYEGVYGLGAGGDYNFKGTPEYEYRQGLGNQALSGMEGFSPDVLQFAQQQYGQNMDLQEQDNAYNRLLDRTYVGQGQAGLAGGQAQQYGSALSSAYQNIGNMNLAAQRAADQSRQEGMYSGLGQASSIPSNIMYQNYRNSLMQQPQQQQSTQYLGNADQYTGDLNYFR